MDTNTVSLLRVAVQALFTDLSCIGIDSSTLPGNLSFPRVCFSAKMAQIAQIAKIAQSAVDSVAQVFNRFDSTKDLNGEKSSEAVKAPFTIQAKKI